jgi:chromate reductase
MKTILAVSGSLRKESFNSALVRAWQAQAPEGVTVDIISADEVRALPPYDTDLEKSAYPKEASALKDRIRRADGVLIATPEYNRAVPGVLKNLLDWTTRPYGDNPFDAKPVYVVGASSGAIGTALAQYNLKTILLYFNARVMGQPEFYVGMGAEKFTDGVLTDEATKEHITKGWAAFLAFIGSFVPKA